MAEIVWGLPGVTMEDKSTQRLKKARSISYSGCWTCRERRIKCDERPVSCANCERSKRSCAGYDIRISWPSNTQSTAGGSYRRRRKIESFQPSVPTKRQTADTSYTASSDGNISQVTDPAQFLISSLQHPTKLPPDLSDSYRVIASAPPFQPCSVGEVQEISEDLSPTGHYLTIDDHPSSFGSTEPCNAVDSPCTTFTEQLQSLYSQTPGIYASEPKDYTGLQALMNTTDSAFSSNSSKVLNHPLDAPCSDGCISASQHTDNSNVRSSHAMSHPPLTAAAILEGLPLSMVGFSNPDAAQLLRHYTNHMVPLMQAVSHENNPFKTIYLRLALEGSQEVACSRRSSLARISIYHSVVACAAINVHWLTLGEASHFYQLACYHRRKGLKAARDALVDKSSTYKEMMTVILALVSIDIIDGGIHDHWIHLEAAGQLRRSWERSRLVGPETQQLNAMCRILGLLAQTALHNPACKPWPGLGTGLRQDFTFKDLGRSIEFLYGLTPFLAKAISNTFELSQYLAFYKDDKYPDSLVDACERLHDELLSWDIDQEEFSSLDEKSGPERGVAKAQATAFYKATLIYHYRSIQRCDRSELRGEQSDILEAMNLAEDLKGRVQKQGHWAAPITWPAFIASCEAIGEDRRRWNQWWDRVQSYGLASYKKQQSIIQSLWSAEEDIEGAADWREMLSNMDIRVIPV